MSNTRTIFPSKLVAVKDNRYRNLKNLRNQPSVVTSGSINATQTSLPLNAASGDLTSLPATGQLRIDNEWISYSGVVSNSGIANASRGAFGSTAGTHTSGTFCPFEGWTVLSGVQSVDIDTNFNVEQVFELGQRDIYQTIENIPEVQITINRVLDGTMPAFLVVTQPLADNLLGRVENFKTDLALSIYPSTQSRASGVPNRTMYASGCFISAATYTFPVDGNFTEEITLVGSDKTWLNSAGEPSGTSFTVAGNASSTSLASGIQRRQNINKSLSEIPAVIPGVTGAGVGNWAGGLDEKIQSITISVDLGREDLFQLGQKTYVSKFVTLPIEVTAAFECVTSEGDRIEALSDRNNLTNQTIKIVLDDGTSFDLGSANTLASMSQGGGDTGGGNETCTYNFTNFNVMDVASTKYNI